MTATPLAVGDVLTATRLSANDTAFVTKLTGERLGGSVIGSTSGRELFEMVLSWRNEFERLDSTRGFVVATDALVQQVSALINVNDLRAASSESMREARRLLEAERRMAILDALEQLYVQRRQFEFWCMRAAPSLPVMTEPAAHVQLEHAKGDLLAAGVSCVNDRNLLSSVDVVVHVQRTADRAREFQRFGETGEMSFLLPMPKQVPYVRVHMIRANVVVELDGDHSVGGLLELQLEKGPWSEFSAPGSKRFKFTHRPVSTTSNMVASTCARSLSAVMAEFGDDQTVRFAPYGLWSVRVLNAGSAGVAMPLSQLLNNSKIFMEFELRFEREVGAAPGDFFEDESWVVVQPCPGANVGFCPSETKAPVLCDTKCCNTDSDCSPRKCTQSTKCCGVAALQLSWSLVLLSAALLTIEKVTIA